MMIYNNSKVTKLSSGVCFKLALIHFLNLGG